MVKIIVISGDYITSLMNQRNQPSSLDIKERDKDYIVTAKVPGYSLKDIKIEIKGETLTISSNVKEAKKTTINGTMVREKSQKSFRRSITIPKGIKMKDISVNLEKGILSISFPKRESESPKRSILQTKSTNKVITVRKSP